MGGPNPETRQTARDPRLLPVQDESLTALAMYGRMAGWAGSVLLILALFWASIAKTINKMPIKIIGILALICIAFWVYSNVHQLVIAIKRRGFQTALSSALFTVIVLGILVMVNYIGGRHEVVRFDLSQGKQFSLSPQTVKILKDLNQKVTITAFISDEAMNAEKLRQRLDDYRRKSSQLEVNIYDTKTAIDKAREYGVRFDGTIFVEAGKEGEKRKEEIQGGGEEQLTSAILSVTTGEKTRVCFLTGHGEGGFTAGATPDKVSYSMLKSVLDNQQYKVDTLSIITQAKPEIPADCKLLVIAGAKVAPTAAEMGAIKRYLDQGGNLLLMLEPSPAPNFADLLKPLGVTPIAGRVRDVQGSFGGRGEILAAKAQPGHDVSGPLEVVVMPTATAFDVQASTPPPSMPGAPPPPTNQNAVPLLKTYSSEAQIVGGTARKGELTLAVAIDQTPPTPPQMPGQPAPPPSEEGRKSRIIVIGDADFAADNILQQAGDFARQNISLAAMSVNWLVKNEKLVSIPPKEPVENPFAVTDTQRRFVWALVVGIIPLLVIAAGGFMWWRRRA